jgi:endonuclease G
MKSRPYFVFLLLVCSSFVVSQASAQVSLTALGTPYTQNFDSLATSGTANPWTDNTTIAGWYAQFSATPANPTTYRADSGGSNTGAIYSWGVAGANALTERAFGMLSSGTPVNVLTAVRFVNNTGATITSLNVSYNGEEWRDGGAATPVAQTTFFEYQIANAGTITDANTPGAGWTAFSSLDMTTPTFTNTGAGAALDGNLAANRVAKSATITITINPGQEVWLRWRDINDAGNDHGLAVDDFSVTPQGTVVNNPPFINAPANPITTVAQDAAPFTVGLSGTDDNNVFNWSAAAGTGISSVVVSGGQGTANVTYTVTLQSGFSGTATFTASLTDNVNAPVTRAVNIAVTPTVINSPPTITAPANPITTVAQDAAPFTVGLNGSDDNNIFNWSAVAGTGILSVVVSAGQGTANVTYTVTLQVGFSGTATFTARLSDNVNPIVTRTVNITVTAAPPPPLDHLVISQIYGGGGNAGATLRNDYVELFNPTTGPIDTGGWTIQYGAATGSTWQIQPLGGVILPGEYYLVQLGSGGANGALLPVTPNVEGSINLSATTGKVALSSNGDPFDGCPVGDPLLVDLVGFGTTANCREGATNAPAPSATNAIFRKAGGFTDTNVNSSDFQTGAPNPRRTAIITEIGPYVLTVDPRNNATTAPRDATMNVTFTEPVTVSGAWFNISCTMTGFHNDATVASVNGNRLWLITPNVNFLAGETCTVTVYKNFVHDDDVDDALPNTDTLVNDYVWSFSVATGTLPPYTADVHLTMGNPSNAVADTLTPNNYLMEKPELAISYNRDKGTPNWVSWHLTDEWIGTLTRVDTFRPDPAVPPDWYRVLHTDYQSTGFDRGHMTPNADRDKETSIPINQATFLMSNMVPQAPDNNQGPWASLENSLRTLLPANELYIVSGPAGVGGTGSNGGVTTTIAGGHVTVPEKTWKCALVLPKLSGNDVLRVTASTQTICVIMPNIQGIRNDDWHIYLTSVDAVETLTGYDLFANVPDAIENAIEAGVNGVNSPGTANSSATTNEDNAASITLDVATPNNNPLTYTITGPSHGTLSGSGTNRTYTPAPDYFGADNFTFNVNDGSHTSNTSTVTITINPVNDPPSAAADSKSTNEDTTLQFPSSDLTVNDSAGPANEAQSLTVTTVSGATHGSVSLAAGVVSFNADADYNGPAGFSYEVCDNGTPVLCTNASVSVTVIAVNDAPAAANDSKSTNEDATLQFASSDLTANDSAGPADESAQSLTVTTVSGATHGSVSLAAGVVSFNPDADYFGAASFSYEVCDNGTPSLCATASVAVSVISVNDAPTAQNDSKTAFEDTTLQFPSSDLTANDSAGPANEAESLTVTTVSGATHGSVSLSAGIVSFLADPNYNGSASFSYTVCDNGMPSFCTSASVSVNVLPVNDPPTASISVPSSTAEGSGVTATVSVSDVDANESFTYAWTVTRNGSPYASGTSSSISFTPDDNGAYDVSVTVFDLANAHGSDLETVTATNVAPAITSVSGPTGPLQLGASATISVTYGDPGTADTHTANLTWDDSMTSTVSCSGGTCTAPHTYAAPGVYGVTIVVSDDDGGSDSATFHSVIVVDNNGGFVTGGGFINTPSGKGNFDVNAKYLPHDATPSGNTSFKLGGSDFKSTSYNWLVVNGAQAQYQGTGTINGSGLYGFLVTVNDGSPDKFRIRVWDTTTMNTVYDNVPGGDDDIDTANPQAIGGGSIVIHP